MSASSTSTPSKDTKETKAVPPQTETEILEAEIELNIRTMKGLLDTIHGANLNAGEEENAVFEAIKRAQQRSDAKEEPVVNPLKDEPKAEHKK